MAESESTTSLDESLPTAVSPRQASIEPAGEAYVHFHRRFQAAIPARNDEGPAPSEPLFYGRILRPAASMSTPRTPLTGAINLRDEYLGATGPLSEPDIPLTVRGERAA